MIQLLPYMPVAKKLQFRFDVKTDNAGVSASNQFTLPIGAGASPMKVDWGDGTIQTISSQTTHTYPVAGTYEIKITNCNSFRFNNGGDKLKLLEVKEVGGLTLNVFGAFYGCLNMTWTAKDAPIIATTVLDFTFRDTNNFNGSFNNWNFTGVTSWARFIQNAKAFNQPCDNIDTSTIESFNNWARGADSFNQDLPFNMISAINIESMLNTLPVFNGDLPAWNLPNVTNAASAIRSCPVFNKDLSDWCVENIPSLPSGFGTNCPAWVLPKPNWGAPC